MGKNPKQSKRADRIDDDDHADHTVPKAPVQGPVQTRAVYCSQFFHGLNREHLTGELSQHSRYAREALFMHLLSFDTNRFPPPSHATSISTEFKTLADTMLRFAHTMGTNQEWHSLLAFQGAFRVRYNAAACAMRTDCIPLDISIMITRLYALTTHRENQKKDDFLGLDYLFHLAAQMEVAFDVSSSDCEQYWTLKFIEFARRAAKGAAAYEANVTVKLYLYFLVANMPKVLGRH